MKLTDKNFVYTTAAGSTEPGYLARKFRAKVRNAQKPVQVKLDAGHVQHALAPKDTPDAQPV